METEKKWEHFIHKADIGIRGLGPTLAAAFEMGALALTNVVADTHTIKANKEIHISCTAPDKEILFADWLNAIIYKMETLNNSMLKYMIYSYGLLLKVKGLIETGIDL